MLRSNSDCQNACFCPWQAEIHLIHSYLLCCILGETGPGRRSCGCAETWIWSVTTSCAHWKTQCNELLGNTSGNLHFQSCLKKLSHTHTPVNNPSHVVLRHKQSQQHAHTHWLDFAFILLSDNEEFLGVSVLHNETRRQITVCGFSNRCCVLFSLHYNEALPLSLWLAHRFSSS